MSTTIALPSKSVEFTISTNNYTVNYPNNGEFIGIEAMKNLLTRDTYATMATTDSVSAQLARYTVDMIAFFSTCCPKLKTDLVVNSLSELDMLSSKKIMKVYIKTILPWLTKWEEILNTDDEEVVEKEEKTA